jgi:hypothetical protein
MKNSDKKPEKNPFRVPEGYFEEVNKKIIAATSGNSSEVPRRVLSLKLKPFLLAAASVAGFIILSYTVIELTSPHRNIQDESGLPQEEYYSPYMNDLDTYSLEENVSSLVMPEEGPEASNSELIEYLVLENIEINDIYEQL